MRMSFLIADLLAVTLVVGGVAHAQSNCDANITKQAGKKVLCKAKVVAKGQKAGLPPDPGKLVKCEAKFAKKCLTAKAGGGCVVHTESCDATEAAADACVDTLTGGSAMTTTTTAPTPTTTPTTTSTTTTTLCASAEFNFQVTAVVDATLRNWPGGSSSFGTASCGVTVAAPSGNISNLQGDTWTVTSTTGFGTCNLSPQLPSCNTVGAVASLLANGRPVCSNSSDVLASGPSTANVIIDCN
jgi:hypothetical protein